MNHTTLNSLNLHIIHKDYICNYSIRKLFILKVLIESNKDKLPKELYNKTIRLIRRKITHVEKTIMKVDNVHDSKLKR